MKTLARDVDIDLAIGEHKEIITEIKNQNGEKALSLLLEHITLAQERAIEAEEL